MRYNRLTVCIITCILLLMLTPLDIAHGQNYVVYNLAVRSDGSALWTIKQFSGTNATVETWESFQKKVFDLVDSAQQQTHRPMDVDESSFQINTTLSLDSKITEYSFVWNNFTQIQGGNYVIGDVFSVQNFFGLLFGDAALQLSYPEGFSIQSVYPQPYERQDAEQIMEWARTQDLIDSKVSVVLAPGNQETVSTGGAAGQLQYGVIAAAIIAVGVSVSLLGFYAFKRRKNNGKTVMTLPEQPSLIETEEDKVLKLLKTASGTMRQSDITERLGFSKAKTSQLLTALENRRILARYKKGRDKIVTLIEPGRES